MRLFCFYTVCIKTENRKVFWVKKNLLMDRWWPNCILYAFKPRKTDVKIHHFILVQPVSLWGLTCLVKVGRQTFYLPVISQWSRQIPKAQCIVFTITPICSMCWRMTSIRAIFCFVGFLKRCIMTLALLHSTSPPTAVVELIYSALLWTRTHHTSL